MSELMGPRMKGWPILRFSTGGLNGTCQERLASLVTTHSSGSSYLNRVELPSTLAGNCTHQETGAINKAMFQPVIVILSVCILFGCVYCLVEHDLMSIPHDCQIPRDGIGDLPRCSARGVGHLNII